MNRRNLLKAFLAVPFLPLVPRLVEPKTKYLFLDIETTNGFFGQQQVIHIGDANNNFFSPDGDYAVGGWFNLEEWQKL